MIEPKIGGTPGGASEIFWPCAKAGANGAASATTDTIATIKALRNMACPPPPLLSFSRADLEFGFLGFAHQGRPDALAQLCEARQSQRRARTRPRQIDGDLFMDARRAALQDDDAVA